MQVVHIQKNVGDSPRKLRLVADMVRSMSPEQAIETLQFTHKAAAQSLAKAIKTALANAGQSEGLIFANLQIDEGLKMKRYHPGTAGRGRGRPYTRRLAHIRIVLSDEVKDQKSRKVAKKLENIVDKKGDTNNGSES